MLIDTHTHYNLEPFFDLTQRDGWKQHWNKAQEAGVQKSIVVGTELISSTIATQIAHEDGGLFASVGIHPNEFHENFLNAQSHKISSYESLFEDLEADLIQLAVLITTQKATAIGETGLDYFRLPKNGEERDVVISLQKQALEKHILMALRANLPLILHVRDQEIPDEKTEGNAYWDALSILQKQDVKRFTLHCVSGPLSYVQAAIELGGYMGFDGNITYPNAQHIREIFSIVPEDRRLVETDAPFLPPQEFRGKTCEPWMLKKTVEYIETHLHADPESFAKNAQKLFNI